MVLFANNCQNVYENQVISNASGNHKFQDVKIKFRVLIALFSYILKGNFKVGGNAIFLGGTGGKIGLNVEKWSLSQGFSREFFQVVPDTSEHSIFILF